MYDQLTLFDPKEYTKKKIIKLFDDDFVKFSSGHTFTGPMTITSSNLSSGCISWGSFSTSMSFNITSGSFLEILDPDTFPKQEDIMDELLRLYEDKEDESGR